MLLAVRGILRKDFVFSSDYKGNVEIAYLVTKNLKYFPISF